MYIYTHAMLCAILDSQALGTDGRQLNKYDDKNTLKQINPYTAGISSFLFRTERIYK